MKVSTISLIGLSVVAVIGLSAPVSAQRSGQPVALFNGYSMDGWAKADGTPHPGWVVQDGALFRQSGGGDLYHESDHTQTY